MFVIAVEVSWTKLGTDQNHQHCMILFMVLNII